MLKGIFAAAALGLAVAAPAQGAEAVWPVPGNGVATCVRDAGSAGLLSLQADVARRSTSTDLLTATPDQVQRAAGADLGALSTCPEVATGGDTTVIAGLAPLSERTDAEVFAAVRVAVRVGGGEFGPTSTADTIGAVNATDIAVAAGSRGDAVVAWREFRWRADDPGPRAVRIRAVRRPPGSDAVWSAPEDVVPWIRFPSRPDDFPPFSGQTDVAAGVDGAGRTTIAWAIAAPTRERGRFSDLSDLGVSTGAAGEPLRAVTLARGVGDIGQIGLAVAPGGAAVLTVPANESLRVWERAPGDGPFAEQAQVRDGPESAVGEAAVALDPSGAAVIAWRFNERIGDGDRYRSGVRALRRSAGQAFGAPTVVWSRLLPTPDSDTSGILALTFAAGGGAYAPSDSAPLRVALSRSGRIAMTWSEQRRVFEDSVASLFVATGALTGDLAATRAGSPCRPINGATPFTTPLGDVAAAWTDNAALGLGFGVDYPSDTGRLHVSAAPAPGTATPGPSPRVELRAPRGTLRLWALDAIDVVAGCDAPCDLRVLVIGGRTTLGATTTTLPQGGRKRLRVDPGVHAFAGRKPRDRTVIVHACSPDGTAFARDATSVRVVANNPPPVPAPTDVRARRSGDDVIVTWRTAFRARRVQFFVVGTPGRRTTADRKIVYATADGRARRRFRTRLRAKAGVTVNWVTVGATSTEGIRGSKEVTVRVER